MTKLAEILKGYDQSLRQFLVGGFLEGFSLGYEGYLTNTVLCQNLKSAREFPGVVREKLEKEMCLRRIAGPFQQAPFSPMFFSPIGIVPKKTPNKFRMIHHLSYPEGASINDAIPHEKSTVSYASIDDAVRLIKSFGPGCYLAKTDIESAFRIIPIHPSNYHLLGMIWQGQYYYDRCLPMGASSSCQIFECFSTSLEWVARVKLGIPGVLHILDDFLFITPTYTQSQDSLDKFDHMCTDVGVPLAADKTVGPATKLSFAGILLDTTEMTASLPPDKVEKCREAVNMLKKRKKVTVKVLQSVTGLLNFACQVVVPGRAFLRRLYDLTTGPGKKSYHHIRLNKQARADLAAWEVFLQHFNGKSFFLSDSWETSVNLSLFTDAAGGLGYGAILGKKWFYGEWPVLWKDANITVLELYPIVAALVTWVHELGNKRILLFTDNMALVHVLNTLTSKEPRVMRLVRKLVVTCMLHNIHFRARHISGHNNVLADSLSRLQVAKFRAAAPWAEAQPTALSVTMQPANWDLDSDTY